MAGKARVSGSLRSDARRSLREITPRKERSPGRVIAYAAPKKDGKSDLQEKAKMRIIQR